MKLYAQNNFFRKEVQVLDFTFIFWSKFCFLGDCVRGFLASFIFLIFCHRPTTPLPPFSPLLPPRPTTTTTIIKMLPTAIITDPVTNLVAKAILKK